LILTGWQFVPNPHVPQLRHATRSTSELAYIGSERGATALLDLPEDNQEYKGREERSKYDEKAEQERGRCWAAATNTSSICTGGGGGKGGGAEAEGR
jgi:hypothetical protein